MDGAGHEHAEFKRVAGDWTCVAKAWHQPGAEPKVDKGTTSFKPVLGGLILRQDYKGTMAGTPFTGLGFTALRHVWQSTRTKRWLTTQRRA